MTTRSETAPASGPITRRFTEQRWLLDNTIRAVGMDWDQPRSIYLSAPCGPEANADFAQIKSRITKLADASPAFEAVARRREAKAHAAEKVHTERLMKTLAGPKRLVVYQDSRHSVGNVPASNLGPFPATLAADWMAATLTGRSFPSEKWYVEATGQIIKTPL